MLVDSSMNRSLPRNGRNNPDPIIGTIGNDQIFGFSTNDMLFGDRGDDRLYGMAGDDFLDGGDGNDSLQSGAGNDTLQGGNGDDILKGDDGNDRLYENAGNNQLWGYEGHDALILTGGNNVASGGNGNDSFSVGGRQNSTLAGGVGFDRYVFGQIIDGNAKPSALPTGRILIREIFNTKYWGTIDLSSLNIGSYAGANKLTMSQVGSDVLLSVQYASPSDKLDITIENASLNNVRNNLISADRH